MRVIFVKIALFFIFEANGSQIKECIYKNSIISIITTPSMSLVKLNIKGISYSQTQNGAYALILIEVDGDRQLPIVIGAFEAQSIAIALEKEIKPPRPLTHDLFKNFGREYNKFNLKQLLFNVFNLKHFNYEPNTVKYKL